MTAILVSALLAPGFPEAPPWPPPRRSGPADAFAQVERMGRGVNIIGYDPLWQDPGQSPFPGAPFPGSSARQASRRCASTCTPFSVMGTAQRLSGSPEAWFKTLDWAVEQRPGQPASCVILDLHNFTDVAKDPAAFKPRLMAFWEQIGESVQGHARRARSSRSSTSRTASSTPPLWNAWLAEALAVIRATNPTRTVVIGPPMWNGIRLPRRARPAGGRPQHHRHGPLLRAVPVHPPGGVVVAGDRQALGRDLGHAPRSGASRGRFRPRPGLVGGTTAGPSSSASSAPTRRPRWSRASAGRPTSPGPRNRSAGPGPTGSSIRISSSTTSIRTLGRTDPQGARPRALKNGDTILFPNFPKKEIGN